MNYRCPISYMRCGLTLQKTSVKRKNRKNWRFRAIMEVFWTNISYFYQHNKSYISYICSKWHKLYFNLTYVTKFYININLFSINWNFVYKDSIYIKIWIIMSENGIHKNIFDRTNEWLQKSMKITHVTKISLKSNIWKYWFK